MKKLVTLYLIMVIILPSIISCRKYIQIQPNLSTLVTSTVFSTPEQARSALAATYYGLINNATGFAAGQITYCAGLSADEFMLYDINSQLEMELFRNNVAATNAITGNNLWTSGFKTIFFTNSIIENVAQSAFADSIKMDLLGQARFIRAFCNFYLVNNFGEIPLVTTSNWQKTHLLPQTVVKDIYDLILSDLLFAKSNLAGYYSKNNNERIIANKYAAIALLAKVYLYLKDWKNAELESSILIDAKSTFSLEGLGRIYAPNSKEAIWQLKQLNKAVNLFSSPEGTLFIPLVKNSNNPPRVYLYPSFLAGMESEDKRRLNWIDSTKLTSNNQVYYYPYKYKVGNGQRAAGYEEYQTVLRLGEQYLIRAEARLEQQKIDDAIDDLNVIRTRAGLPLLLHSMGVAEVRRSMMKERQIELFAEWGNRWFDLKRWNLADEVLGALKGDDWQPGDAFYPIPASEIMSDPNLAQNAGY